MGSIVRPVVNPAMPGYSGLGNFASGGSIGSVMGLDVVAVAQTTAANVLTIDTPTDGKSRRVIIANTGTAGFWIYARFIRPGASAEFVHVPSVGWRSTVSSAQVIEQNWAGATAPANDANENTLFTATIPGGVMGANGVLSIRTKWQYTNSANNKVFRARLGASQLCTFTATTSGCGAFVWDINNRNSESAQLGTNGGGGGVAGGTVDTATIDTSADQTLTITAQKATGTETVTFLGVSVLLQRFV
jgi:hypothetical protein